MKFYKVIILLILVSCASQRSSLPNNDSDDTASTTSKDPIGEARAISAAIYGDRGIYDGLKICNTQSASRAYGGTGHMIWSEPSDPMPEDSIEAGDGEAAFKYLRVLRQRQTRLSRQLDECKLKLKNSEMEPSRSQKVSVTEIQKSMAERSGVDEAMCELAKSGQSLSRILEKMLVEGWVTFQDVRGTALMSEGVTDDKGLSKDHVFRLNQWRLAFDRDVREFARGDAKLEFWLADSACVSQPGQWTNN